MSSVVSCMMSHDCQSIVVVFVVCRVRCCSLYIKLLSLSLSLSILIVILLEVRACKKFVSKEKNKNEKDKKPYVGSS